LGYPAYEPSRADEPAAPAAPADAPRVELRQGGTTNKYYIKHIKQPLCHHEDLMALYVIS